ncbi:ABC transporter permease [Gordonia sp. MP11Mi]|uniref:ABC transporter permease n=1 Tax=Gordonia sp. MP11Mi TaxID=3022769 RepID=A0AA97D028_9ACTN
MTTILSKYTRVPRIRRGVLRVAGSVRGGFYEAGRVVVFVVLVLCQLPIALRQYSRQALAASSSLAWGRGRLIADGGVVSVLAILGVAIGAGVAIEGYAGLDIVGFGPLTGVLGGLAIVRELAPTVAGIGFAAQAGCRMTAEIGSMRVSEEIDATEALGIRTIPFVVGTKLVGAMVCVVPAYLLSLVLGFVSARSIVTLVHGLPTGTYDHYFTQFLSLDDIGYSTLKVAVFCAVVTLTHCYFGFFASGGPEGVGIASGRAIRASIVLIVTIDLALTVLIWSLVPSIEFVG